MRVTRCRKGGPSWFGPRTFPSSREDGLDGDFVRLSVIDTGIGMPLEVIERVFEPFFTTKEIGKGSGPGLAQVHGFATQSGGTVRIESEAGRGTQVILILPRSIGPRSGSAALDRSGSDPAHNGSADACFLLRTMTRLPRLSPRCWLSSATRWSAWRVRAALGHSRMGARSMSGVRHHDAGRYERGRSGSGIAPSACWLPGVIDQRLCGSGKAGRGCGRRAHPTEALPVDRACSGLQTARDQNLTGGPSIRAH